MTEPQAPAASPDLVPFSRWLGNQRGLAAKTAHNYLHAVEGFEPFAAMDPAEGIKAYIDAHPGAPSTIGVRLAALRSWARFSGLVELTAALEATDRPRARHGLPRPVEDWRERVKDWPAEWRATATFFALTGLRLSEAMAVCEEPPIPVDLRVTGKGSKTRIVPLTKEAQAALTALGGRIPFKPRVIQTYFRKHGGFSPHQLRHERASSIIRAGGDVGDVAKVLGHSNIATSMGYAAFGTDRLRRVLEEASR